MIAIVTGFPAFVVESAVQHFWWHPSQNQIEPQDYWQTEKSKYVRFEA